MLSSKHEAGVLGSRIQDVPLGAPIIIELAIMRLHNDTAPLEASRQLDRGPSFRNARTGSTDCPKTHGRTTLDAAGSQVNDAAECVGSVRDRPRPTCDFNPFEHEWVEECGAGADAPL